jgi:RimJ/RimL family protein N-acetyltransferase
VPFVLVGRMSAPPKTVLTATPEEEAAIRAAVRGARLDPLSPSRLARVEDAAACVAFFADPRVSDPIYDLPRPFTEANVRAWIERHVAAHERGESILSFTWDGAGEIVGYNDITVWPQHSSAEFAGATRASQQNQGRGAAGIAGMVDLIFGGLGVRLICLTAALDNVRSQKVIDGAGFTRMGGRDGVRPDGTTRASVYWEMTRDEWLARKR